MQDTLLLPGALLTLPVLVLLLLLGALLWLRLLCPVRLCGLGSFFALLLLLGVRKSSGSETS